MVDHPLSKALPSGKHKFTAYAMEVSGLGNAEGKSNEVGFEVNTLPPEVTLGGPERRSNQETPDLTGTASETEPVKIEIFKGTKAEGTAFIKLGATVTNHAFATKVTKDLEQGQYVAVASEPSSLGNPTGVSKEVPFEVIIGAPTVYMSEVLTPSNNATPSFSGTESESQPCHGGNP